MSSDSDDSVDSYDSDSNHQRKERAMTPVSSQQLQRQTNQSSELLAPPPKVDPHIIDSLHFEIPPDIAVDASNWREFQLPQVPLPNDNEIEEEIAHRFDLASLYRQIRTA